MSSMLEQAIVDAKALKEAALKSAQNAVIEQYSGDIKEAVNKMLREDDMDMDMEDEGSEAEEQDLMDPEDL